jgi:hypothetical protein
MEFAKNALESVDSGLVPFLDAQEFQRQMALLSPPGREWGVVGRQRSRWQERAEVLLDEGLRALTDH